MLRSFLKVSMVRIAIFGLIVSLSIFGFPGKAYAEWQCRLLSPSDPTNFNNFLGEGFGITQDAARTAAMNDCLRLNDRTGCSFGFPSYREMPDNITPPPPPPVTPPPPPLSDNGYFDNGATVFYTSGKSYCGFASPKHYQFFQKVNPARSLGKQNPSVFGTYTGACDLPSGYFDNGATVFYSAGNGTFCGFPNPTALNSHQRSRPEQPRFGRIDISPNDFMSNTGVCR